MKKKVIAAAVLGFVLFISCSAAENMQQQSVPSIRDTLNTYESSFKFRSGVTWGMNQTSVQETEPIKMDRYSSGDWSVMISSEPVEVSRFTADLVYMFQKDSLQMITYEFLAEEGNTLNYQYLTGALCSVYGENKSADIRRIKRLMDCIYPGRYSEATLAQAFEWNTQDGTSIFQYYYSENRFAILYVYPGMENRNGEYIVNGL